METMTRSLRTRNDLLARRSEAIARTKDALPVGRKASPIVDGQYPASYFPNTELLGADEMRITALGAGMPNQTKRAVSISYFVELGNGKKFLFEIGPGAMGKSKAITDGKWGGYAPPPMPKPGR
jgi:hypothetical protein